MTANRQRRRGRQLTLVATLAILASPILGRQDQPPRFRTSVDVVRLDVSVLDRERRPVRGLTREDFTVLVDGEPQEVVALTEVEAPGSTPALHDVLSRFDLKPGRYAIRASAHNVPRDRSGSVYADITVPNYAIREASTRLRQPSFMC